MEMAEVINLIRNMISAAHDDEYEYRSCAGEALSDELCAMLGERAERAVIYRRELEDLLVLVAAGSRTGALRTLETLDRRGAGSRAWAARSPATNDEALLLDCERKEDELLMRYRDALEEELPLEVRRVLELRRRWLLADPPSAQEPVRDVRSGPSDQGAPRTFDPSGLGRSARSWLGISLSLVGELDNVLSR